MTGTGDPVCADRIFAALEATWPPERWHTTPGWRVAAGNGGGKRVSSARARLAAPDLAEMEHAQACLGQPPLAFVGTGEGDLDSRLAARGYRAIDPTVALSAPVATLAADLPRITAFEVAWPPLAFQCEIWSTGGIGPERLAVMDRAGGPKISLLGRIDDRPSATAFLAVHDGLAMLHALEVLPQARRKGLARHLMIAAARWAADHGAQTLAVLVTRANAPALGLYRGLGMTEVTSYHYRLAKEVSP